MGREVRLVPKNWKHPTRKDGTFKPLMDREFKTEDSAYSEEEYMPNFTKEEKTHFQMYETCSEGTPISPVCASPEELAQWLTDNHASAFAGMTASYYAWLKVCKGSPALSMVLSDKGLESGVEGLYKKKDDLD